MVWNLLRDLEMHHAASRLSKISAEISEKMQKNNKKYEKI